MIDQSHTRYKYVEERNSIKYLNIVDNNPSMVYGEKVMAKKEVAKRSRLSFFNRTTAMRF